MNSTTLTRLAFALVAVAFILVTANDSQAQVSIDAKAKVGVSSATIDDVSYGDPIFDVGGGGQVAVMLKFKGGIGAGLNFNYQYDGHRNAATTTGAAKSSMSFSAPSIGIKARFSLMPNVEGGAWANYVFGSATVDRTDGNTDIEWVSQGFEVGGEAVLAYQLKPYKTYILAGAYAYFQYLQMFAETQGANDMSAQNYGVGASLGARFDFAL